MKNVFATPSLQKKMMEAFFETTHYREALRDVFVTNYLLREIC
jgi:hypothetical protein